MKVGTDAMLLGAMVVVESKSNFLDIGTGTGVISLMLLQRNPAMSGVGLEIDELSSIECLKNFKCSPWSSSLSIKNIDFTDFESEIKFDLIVSNPPYFQTRNLNDDERKARARHESSLPLVDLMEKASRLLSNEGDLWLIVPFEDSNQWENTAKNNGLFLKARIDIYGKVDAEKPKRVVFNWSKLKSESADSRFEIRNAANQFSDEYIELTKEYHLNSLR